MDPFVPLGRVVDDQQRTCNYSPSNSRDTDCGADGAWHVMWNPQAEVSFACDPHMAEARARFVFVGAHPVGPDCGMPGALWDIDENRCVHPDSPAAESAEASAPLHVQELV
ncbi:hypothetical protein [Streptomyces liliifuscus]|uniref:Uncharacterized protein n=1 Tax=Streptomyces liliifuscus TaxID=2797636 RepID=A0A7T7L297_9ACTN|nr:hypothetical protein [Streptomyces liliifuscus]QQM45143.1 hypothetical protein JEQ17_40930 [Streptomyces liliifuscus]